MVTFFAHLHLVFTDISNLDRDDNDSVRFTVACKDDFSLNLQRGNLPVSAAMVLLLKAELWLRESAGTCAQYCRGLLKLLCRMHLTICIRYMLNTISTRICEDNLLRIYERNLLGHVPRIKEGWWCLCRMHRNHLYQICAEYNLNYDMRGQSYENLMKLLWSVNLTTMLLSESQEVTWKKRRSLVRLQRTTGNR